MKFSFMYMSMQSIINFFTTPSNVKEYDIYNFSQTREKQTLTVFIRYSQYDTYGNWVYELWSTNRLNQENKQSYLLHQKNQKGKKAK